jgi:hypothetical protein
MFPQAIRNQISQDYTVWPDFCAAIAALKYGSTTDPVECMYESRLSFGLIIDWEMPSA